MLLIDEHRRAAALAIAQETAARIATQGTMSPVTSPSTPQRPAQPAPGGAGLVPLYAALDQIYPDAGWDELGHPFLKQGLLEADLAAGGPAGLLDGGAACVGVAAVLLRGRTGRYQKLLDRLDAVVGPSADHDLTCGTAGAGVYVLLRPQAARREAVARGLIRGAAARPPFPVPAHRIPPAWTVGEGYADCGLAHGAAGPLAVLSLLATRDAGITADAEGAGSGPDLRPAIAGLAEWLLAHARHDEWGTTWPAGVAGDEWYPSPLRASWCYGVPGIARGLWLAGDALAEPRYRRAARDAMLQLLGSPAAWGLDSANLCHGLAGLLLVTSAFAAADRDDDDDGQAAGPRFAEAADELFDRLCAAYAPRRPLGFDVSGPGLLGGAAGIALALLAATGDLSAAPMFLVA